jgi:adenylate cyclase
VATGRAQRGSKVGMNARLEKKLRLLAVIIAAGTIAGLAVEFAQGRTSASSMVVGFTYGLLMYIAIGGVELFVLGGPMRGWLGDLSFTASLIVRSAIYAAIIMVIQLSQSGEVIAGLPRETSSQNFWFGFIYSAVISVLINLILGSPILSGRARS